MAKPRDEAKVEAIFKAALKLVLDTGFAGLKMSAVAQEARLATGTLYTYFNNKEDLINQLFRELKRAKMREVFENYDPALPFYEGFKILWYNYLKAGLKQPERNLFIEQYQRSDYLDAVSKALSENAYEPFYAFLEKAKTAQIIKNFPVEVMAAQLMGGANQVAKLYFRRSRHIDESVTDQCFEMAWHSIRK